MSQVMSVNESGFQEQVLEAGGPVLVDFYAPWCGYCTRLAPILDEVAAELSDKVSIVKVNVDESRSLAQKYGVMSLPTMLVFKGGQQVEKMVGFLPKINIVNKLTPHF